jgi:hypothetical protein
MAINVLLWQLQVGEKKEYSVEKVYSVDRQLDSSYVFLKRILFEVSIDAKCRVPDSGTGGYSRVVALRAESSRSAEHPLTLSSLLLSRAT